jgi:hypothetical protein
MRGIFLFAVLAAGCGSTNYSTPVSIPTPTPSVQNASVTGQYNLVLASTNGLGTTDMYANFTQAGKTFVGAANTLVCRSNDLSQCQGQDTSGVSITPNGMVSGASVTIVISVPTTAMADTVTMTGTATGTNLAGTYTDSLGDAGTWTASAAGSLSGSYNGTFNSTPNPLPIAPTVLLTLAQDSSFDLSGAAMIMSSPCISSLVLSGQAIGGAFSMTDAAHKARMLVLPTGNSFNFTYQFEPTAASCAGDSGRGVLTINSSPWNY